ncbi:hypothetical protein JCM33374_g1651 [Metschnikowia sp. JCM 33374]|nr:hypothetical protein JCM33374_g1651 [Metschnikowia sp. JCM 33374]
MADPAKRITSHMNKDHQLALVDYVVVYGNEQLSDINAQSVLITDVTVEQLVLGYTAKTGKEKKVALSWNSVDDGEGLQVKSMSDIKAKLIAMAKYAASKQGYSHKQVTQVLPPSSAGSLIAYVFAALTLATLVKKDFLRTVMGLCGLLGTPKADAFLEFFEKRIFAIAVATYAIHIVEVVFLTWPKTVKYRMPWTTSLAWIGFTFMEGIFMSSRLRSVTE